ncbi:hypothetical protein ACEPPN_014831 [Leptodophora sp. 'Broadleaf-Isolate-01']
MSRTTNTQPTQTPETMKIQHLTHEESHDSLPNMNKRLSASMKVRSFISRRLSRNLDNHAPQPYLSSHYEEGRGEEGDRPTTVFPRMGFGFSESKNSLPEKQSEKGKESASEMTGYLVQKHRVEKAEKKQEKILSSANSSGSYLPLRSPIESSSTNAKTKTKIRGKGIGRGISSFSDLVKEKIYKKTEPSAAQKLEERGDKMVKIYNLRKAMLEGKLERVVPPPSGMGMNGSGAGLGAGGENRRPPPRPAHNPFLDNISSVGPASSRQPCAAPVQVQVSFSRTSQQSDVRQTSRTRKTKSASSKIASLIGSSADMMDETRRGIQGKFREPFEHLNYPSFSLGRREDGDDGDGDSDESFFCLGDVELGVLGTGGLRVGSGSGIPMRRERVKVQRDEREGPRPKTRGKGSERGEKSSVYGHGREVQAPGEEVVKKCKLCGLGIVASTRGLCAECEEDFKSLRLKAPTVEMEITYSDSEYEDDIVEDDHVVEEDDIPPTLPLKIRKQATNKPEPGRLEHDLFKPGNPFVFQDSDSDNGKPPIPPPKDDIILGLSLPNRTYKPSISPANPTSQSSQRGEIELELEAEIQSTMDLYRGSGGWQNDSVSSPTYEEAQRLLDRWSECFGDGAVEGMRGTRGTEGDEDGIPLVRAMDCDGVRRDSEFYRFWDGVLKEHAPRTSRGPGEVPSTGEEERRRR